MKKINKFLSLVLSAALVCSFGGWNSIDVNAAEYSDASYSDTESVEYTDAAYEESLYFLSDDADEIITEESEEVAGVSCAAYAGSNKGDNNYKGYAQRWEEPNESFLVKVDSTTYLRVQAGATSGKFVAIYYNSSDFSIKDVKEIALPLPIFGGFYASGGYYYIVTGKENASCSDSAEVIRVTRYDSNWNISGSSISIKGFNTTIPFDAANLRFTEYGNYIFVRSGHEMYSGHQASIMFSFNKSTMALIESLGIVGGAGYSSHSFNEFIDHDGSTLVTVDHGDAYPRTIVLAKYGTAITAGKFDGSAKKISMLDIPGAIGENCTGTTIGGLGISSSKYIVVGNSTIKNSGTYSDTDARNIFISVTDKNLTSVNRIWVTDYAAKSGQTTSTPHLVKLGTDSFLLMWSEGGTVKYVKLDGNGNTVGSIYSMSGYLSDCQPIVADNNVIWYVWDGFDTTFYQIPVSDPGSPKTKVITSGHNYVNIGNSGGNATLRCSKCGDTKTVVLPTSYSIYWNNSSSNSNTYSSRINTTINAGDILKIWVYSYTPSNANADYVITSSDPSVLSVVGTEIHTGRSGTATISITSLYNSSLKYNYTYTVVGGDPTLSGASIRLTRNNNIIAATMPLSATPGYNVDYSWYLYKENVGWVTLSNWKKNDNSLSAVPPMFGNCILLAKARFSDNPSIETQATISVECHPTIKGVCQMPYTGAGGGYLIGIESYSNPNNEYKYEMLILDCTLLSQGKDSWVYTTTPCQCGGNCLWTVWQPQYGYYWTLFRIYDKNDNLLDEVCYPFVNAY